MYLHLSRIETHYLTEVFFLLFFPTFYATMVAGSFSFIVHYAVLTRLFVTKTLEY